MASEVGNPMMNSIILIGVATISTKIYVKMIYGSIAVEMGSSLWVTLLKRLGLKDARTRHATSPQSTFRPTIKCWTDHTTRVMERLMSNS